ncbi:hypothetical protein Hsar01_03366 [Haloferula sargassicola]|uniref:PEP-CTERM sorting domain-containing protein n=1 Tax=Haloferula sargassicola TaxID=490096 RepID=A0ABP9UUR5_9BACT
MKTETSYKVHQIKRIGAGAISAGLICGTSFSATLLEWNTYGNTGTETEETSVSNTTGLLSSTMTIGPGVTLTSSSDRFGGRSFYDSTTDSNPTTLNEAIADGEYIQFTVTPQSGYSYSVTDFSFIWDRSGTGPDSVALRSSGDNYASTLASASSLASGNTTVFTNLSFNLTSLTSATTFRLYAYGATSSAGNAGFDTSSNSPNIKLLGSVSAIPEPTGITSGALLAAGLFYRARPRGIKR